VRTKFNRTAACEHGNELSGSVKGVKFFNKLSDYQLLKKDSAARS
jgi:hypothetical protein